MDGKRYVAESFIAFAKAHPEPDDEAWDWFVTTMLPLLLSPDRQAGLPSPSLGDPARLKLITKRSAPGKGKPRGDISIELADKYVAAIREGGTEQVPRSFFEDHFRSSVKTVDSVRSTLNRLTSLGIFTSTGISGRQSFYSLNEGAFERWRSGKAIADSA